jgi:hypothetical protein
MTQTAVRTAFWPVKNGDDYTPFIEFFARLKYLIGADGGAKVAALASSLIDH